MSEVCVYGKGNREGYKEGSGVMVLAKNNQVSSLDNKLICRNVYAKIKE